MDSITQTRPGKSWRGSVSFECYNFPMKRLEMTRATDDSIASGRKTLDKDFIDRLRQESKNMPIDEEPQESANRALEYAREIDISNLPNDRDLIRSLERAFRDVKHPIWGKYPPPISLSDCDQELVKRVDKKLTLGQWEAYKRERIAKGIPGNPEEPPKIINEDFRQYLNALRIRFESDAPYALLQHFVEACRIIDETPSTERPAFREYHLLDDLGNIWKNINAYSFAGGKYFRDFPDDIKKITENSFVKAYRKITK